MEYRWYKNGRIYVKSDDSVIEYSNIFNITQEYYDDYIGNQKHYEGDLSLYGSEVTSLGKLESVEDDLNLHKSKVTSLGNLKSVGGFLSLPLTGITSLGNLESVGSYGGCLHLQGAELTSLGNLKSVGGIIYCTLDSSTYELFMNSEFRDKVTAVK